MAGDWRGSSSATLADTTAVLRCIMALGGIVIGGGGSTLLSTGSDFSPVGMDAKFASYVKSSFKSEVSLP